MSIISDALAQASISRNKQDLKPREKKPQITLLVSLISLCLILGLIGYKTMPKTYMPGHHNTSPDTHATKINPTYTSLGNPQGTVESIAIQGQVNAIKMSPFNNSLQGIIQGADGYHAILNNEIVSVNSNLPAGTVTNITNSTLTLKTADGDIILSLA